MTIPTFILLASMAVFGVTLLMNIQRLNRSLIQAYTLESICVALILIAQGYEEHAMGMIAAGLLTLAVKGIMAPTFLFRMIKRYESRFSVEPYLNLSMTLVVLSVIIISFRYIVVQSIHFGNTTILSLLFAGVFTTLFFIVNHRGALSQIIGILALENTIVLLAAFLGVAHSVALELAIAFDVGVWTVIAVIFLSMLHRYFGSIENVSMTHLKEE